MKVRYYIIIAIICFGTILYYLASDWTVSFPWTMNLILFFIGEIFFALGIGKMLKRNREYHEKYIWNDENSEI